MSQVDKLVRAFKTVAQYSTPIAASILNITGPNVCVVSTWSQRNLDRKLAVQLQMTQIVNMDTHQVDNLGSVEVTTELLSSLSPSGKYRSVFRESPAMGKVSKKQFLEIWKENKLWKVVDVTSLEVHGDIYTDNDFGTFEWSGCEEKILYVAEKKVAKCEPFISSKSPSKKPEESTKGTEYLLVEDWGEALVGKSHPVLAVARYSGEGEVEVIGTGDEELCMGQGVWSPDGGVVGVAWTPSPRRLGLVYCTNRTSWIFHASPHGGFRKLSGDGLAVRSPQFSPDGKSLVWLERPAGGPHHACHRLVKYDWTTGNRTVVIDIVQDEVTCLNGKQFYGLFNLSLKHCWLPDSKTVIISTPQRVEVKTYLIDTVENTISELDCGTDESQGVLGNKNGAIVCWRSSLLNSPGLYFTKNVLSGNIKWIPLLECKPLGFAKVYHVEVLHLQASAEKSDSIRTFSALYLGPKAGKDVPLVVWPHGGPHSCFTNSFSLIASFFATIGFAMVMVNYRGSAGNGQNSVEHLLGRVGMIDVADMHQAATHVLGSKPCLSQDKTLLFGGSHGGFLVLHLSAKFPSVYKSCAALNPVVDLPSFTSSDIPDWAVVETGFEWTPTGSLTTEMFEKMKAASPLSHVDSVIAPTLLLLGKKDLRVPPHQGLAYYYALKARNVKTKVLMYEDNHPLLQTMHEADFAINTVLWYLEAIEHEVDWSSSDVD